MERSGSSGGVGIEFLEIPELITRLVISHPGYLGKGELLGQAAYAAATQPDAGIVVQDQQLSRGPWRATGPSVHTDRDQRVTDSEVGDNDVMLLGRGDPCDGCS
jgi:hypothetical protein